MPAEVSKFNGSNTYGTSYLHLLVYAISCARLSSLFQRALLTSKHSGKHFLGWQTIGTIIQVAVTHSTPSKFLREPHPSSYLTYKVMLMLRIYAMYGKTRTMMVVCVGLAVLESIAEAIIFGTPLHGTIRTSFGASVSSRSSQLSCRHQQSCTWCLCLCGRRSSRGPQTCLQLASSPCYRKHPFRSQLVPALATPQTWLWPLYYPAHIDARFCDLFSGVRRRTVFVPQPLQHTLTHIAAYFGYTR